ncbi:conserved hypothetical protein [Micromonospora sp. ATCC 39149]|uniref:Uncharacterized protein n=1 Tax=Micromonospora carbonacea TaxID=47853 RepID=A0A7D6CGH9_9ACTN|nr:hypothetical protein [Micromonospora sp. ATCC 39149]EEP75281.1 conserved hypothetical protein [Micromonospora sp. ATCC 39149]QLK01000.1 hypothetical protein HZU44_14015 [Micromonospora carbonacea]
MSRLSGLRDAWAQTGRPVRAACLAMWSAGGLGTAVGAAGDQLGWWNDRPFLTNLMSSLVGALFGIPLALIVLRRITAMEGRRTERADALHIARGTAARLAADLAPLCPDRRLAERAAATLRRLDDELLAGLTDHRFGPALAEALTGWMEAVHLCGEGLLGGPPAGDALRDAAATWRHLRSDVAPRLRTYGVSWPSRAAADRVDRLLADVDAFLRGDPSDAQHLAEAARVTLSERTIAPLVAVYADEYAVLGGIREQVGTLSAGVAAVVALLAAVDQLTIDLPDPYRNT